MKFYRPIIVSGVLGIVALNLALDFSFTRAFNVLQVFIIVLIPTGIFTLLTRIMPENFFNYNNFIFRTRASERGFLEKLGVKKWKANVPELGGLVNFRKNKLQDPRNKTYMAKFLDESCRGELVHSFSVIWGFFALLFIPYPLVITAGLPLSIIHGFLHLLPVLIQRYIRIKMVKIYERLVHLEQGAEMQALEV